MLTVTVDDATGAAATTVTLNPEFDKWSAVDAQLRACLLAISPRPFKIISMDSLPPQPYGIIFSFGITLYLALIYFN